MISDTSRITGASDARSFSCWTSASNATSSRCSTSPTIWPSADLPGAVEPLERGLELGRDRDQRPHLASGDHLERADRVLVGRIGHRERELVFVLGQRQRARLAQEARRHALLEDRQFGIAGGLDQRQAELRGQRLGHVALRDDAERDQQRAELLARLLLQAQRAFEPGGVELAALDQDLADAHSLRLRSHVFCAKCNR